jgi:hypothetical protein
MENILRCQASKILDGIKNYKHDYVIHNERVGYIYPEGIKCHGVSWLTTFAYYYEVERGALKCRPQSEAGIMLNCGDISYAELPTHFEHIMGVSGTLHTLPKCQKIVLNDWYKISQFYYIPSIYGENKR